MAAVDTQIVKPVAFSLGTTRVSTADVLGVGDAVWTVRPYLRCDRLEEKAAPAIDQATLRYEAGDFALRDFPEVAEVGGSTVQTRGIFDPLSLNRKYVKIELLDGENPQTVRKTWYGVIEITDEDFSRNDDGELTGPQRFLALGLLRLLDQQWIRSSRIAGETGEQPQTIGRALTFNLDQTGAFATRGNRTGTAFGGGTVDDDHPDYEGYIFSLQPRSRSEWNGSQAIEYLLEYHAPSNGASSPTGAGVWYLAPGSTNMLDWYPITVNCERRTVKDVLDEICDRRRLAGYWVYGEENTDDDTFDIIVLPFTFAESNIALPSGDQVLANVDQINLIYGQSPLIRQSSRELSVVHAADRIICEGEYVTSTASFWWEDFQEGWATEQQTAYLAGDSSSADADRNTAARSRDEWRDVFSKFIIDETWDRVVTRDSDSEDFLLVVPYEDIPAPASLTDEDVEDVFLAFEATPGPWWPEGKLFLRRLAFTVGEEDEYGVPFFLFPEAADDWRFAEKVNQADADGTTRPWAVSVGVLDDTLGFRLDVTKPGARQLIAETEWGAASPSPAETHDADDPDNAESQALDYQDGLFTGTIEWDERVRAEYQISAVTAGAHERVMLIRVPDARLDFEIPGTATDVAADGTLVESTGRVIRDDRNRLRDIARAAAEWYGTTRRALRLSYNDTTPFVSIGQLVVEADGETANTVISSISYDFQAAAAELITSYASPDFLT